ncbi:MAG TPA: hypothetical protein VIO83_00540 [Pseudomonas sp.]
MQVESFFEWLGEALGTLIRVLVESLSGLFGLLSSAGRHFLDGLSHALGMQPSLLGFLTLVIGLLLLAAAVRAFIRRAFVRGTIWLLLGLWLLSWLIQ